MKDQLRTLLSSRENSRCVSVYLLTTAKNWIYVYARIDYADCRMSQLVIRKPAAYDGTPRSRRSRILNAT